MLGDGGQLAQEGLGDLAVGGDDDLARLAVDDVERDLLAEEDVGERLGQTFAELVDLGLVLLVDLLALAAAVGGGELLLLEVDAARDLDVHDDAIDARGDDERSVLHVGGLLAEDRAEEFLLGGELGLGLRGDLADEDVAGLHLGADADDAVVVEVLEGFLAHVRDVARNLLRPELGVTGGDLEFLDMDRGEDVLLEDLLGDEDGVLEVVAVPRHERDEHVAAQGHLALVGRGTVGDDVAGLHLLAALDDRALVEAGAGVRAHELAELIHPDVALLVGLRVALEVAGHLTVLGDDDALGIHRGDDAGLKGDEHRLGVAGNALLDAGAHDGRVGLEERHALALHVRTHERAIGVVVLEERDQAGGDGDELLGRDIHEVDRLGVDFEEVAAVAHSDLADEVALLVELGVGLGDDLALLLVGGEVLDLVRHAAVLADAVRRLDEAELVDAGIEREGVDETDVRTFGGLDRADAAVVRGVHVAHLEAGAVAVETARPERGETTLVRQFRERVDLVHELRELAAREEVADHRRQSLRIDELLRGDRVHALVIEGHALAHQALGAGEAHTALVGEEFAHGADAAGTEVVDVVDDAVALAELDEILGGLDDVLGIQDTGLEVGLEAELLVDLVAADAAEIVALRIEEEALEEGLGVGGGRRLAGTEALVDFLERLLLVAGRVLLERTDDHALVVGGVDHAHGRDLVLLEGADDGLGEWLEGAGENDTLLRIDDVLDEDEGGDVLDVEGLGDLEVLDLVEEIEDVDVAGVADGAEQRRDEELPATAAAIEIDVEEIVVVELDLEPGAAIGDDTERMEELAVRVRGDLEAQAGRTVELGDHDALGAVDDEGAALGHHRDLAHVDLLVLDVILLAEAKLHIERHRIGDAFAEALDLGVLGITDRVGNVLEDEALVVGRDREDFAEDGLQAVRLALALRHLFLQILQIGVDLNLDEIRRLDDFAELTEILAFLSGGHKGSRVLDNELACLSPSPHG